MYNAPVTNTTSLVIFYQSAVINIYKWLWQINNVKNRTDEIFNMLYMNIFFHVVMVVSW
jgi:hypothetical protein